MSDNPFRHYRFETYGVDTQTRELRNGDGAVIPLTAKAFDTLCVLIANRHRVVGKEELLAAVWPGRIVEDNNLTQAIATARRAFGAEGGDHRYIVTVPGRGYRFVADVDEADPGICAGSQGGADTGARSAATAAPVAPAGSSWQPMIAIGALVFVLALFSVAAWQLREAPSSPAQPQPQPQASLAVLPFRSLSPGARDELLELGLADTLITRLSRSDALRVSSLGSARRLAGSQQDARDAGRQLGADYVIEGSTQRVGDHVRVNARLLSVARGTALWSDTFDARIDRVFTLQDDIAKAVTSALAMQPVDVSERSVSACDGADAQAYRALLRAQHELHRRAQTTIASFHGAIRRDPACARAYAGLAVAYLFMAHNDRPPKEVFPLAKAAALQALRIDPGSAEAHMAYGRYLQLHEWNWPASEEALRRAIDINPSLAEAHFGLAHLLISTGRFDEGLAAVRHARELDPLSPLIGALEAGFLTAAQRPDDARAALARTLELEPEFWIALLVRGGMALDRGDAHAAIAALGRGSERSLHASQILAMLAVAHVAAGDRRAAEAILRELETRDAAGYVPATSLAAVRNALGDTDGALDLLERAYQEHDVRLAFLGVDSRWNNLRAQPRFRALARQLGLGAGPAHGRY